MLLNDLDATSSTQDILEHKYINFDKVRTASAIKFLFFFLSLILPDDAKHSV